eukprot:TRINITY_DN20459_c0_g1_i3.p1 TRINITY_DN20459_c0_g1~~TRINITY_DN20459_c0_g1_i3.p1  ORF type:complete len:1612 (+),score=408.84 TRINITY_DN20459_c0_g1_i3:720-5555(+)
MDPPELAGIYAKIGMHCGRPAYRLMDDNGQAKQGGSKIIRQDSPEEDTPQDSNFEFSQYGYCLRWYPPENRWLLGEYSKTISVTYPVAARGSSIHPADDLLLTGEPGSDKRVLAVKLGNGPASRAFVPVQAELVGIDGYVEEQWQYEAAEDILDYLELPATLHFRCEGFSNEPDAVARLTYDAPYPCSVYMPWQVTADGDLWFYPDKFIRCCEVEPPPRRLRVNGYMGNPKILNGLTFEMLPTLHNGRVAWMGPSMVDGKTYSLFICWLSSRNCWVACCSSAVTEHDHEEGVLPFEPGVTHVEPRWIVAQAACHAGSPTSILQHGGFWVTRNRQKRTFNVVAAGEQITLPELSSIITRTLKDTLAKALDEANFIIDEAKMSRAASFQSGSPDGEDGDSSEASSDYDGYSSEDSSRLSASRRSSMAAAAEDPSEETSKYNIRRPRKILELATPQTRMDGKRMAQNIADIDRVLEEAIVAGISRSTLHEAYEAKRRLYGWSLLDSIREMGEKKDATTAQWFETLTSMKASLRQYRPDPNLSLVSNGWTLCHYIARYGPTETWTYEAAFTMLQQKADLERREKGGMSPVVVAILTGKRENVRAFLRLMCPAAAELPYLVQSKSDAVVDFYNAVAQEDATVKDLRGFVGRSGSHQFLNMRFEDGLCALHHLALRNQASMIEYLCHERADVNIQDADGNTPCHLAAQVGSQVSLMVMLRQGAKVTIRNNYGRTAYMTALDYCQESIARELRKQLVNWEDIEALLGKSRVKDLEEGNLIALSEHVRSNVRKLLHMGFGDEAADCCAADIKRTDKLQLCNQIVARDPDVVVNLNDNEVAEFPESHCCLLEMRGLLLVHELLIPLLSMAGEDDLILDNDKRYKRFTEYLMETGIQALLGMEVQVTVRQGFTRISESFDELTSKVGDDMQFIAPKQLARPNLQALALTPPENVLLAHQLWVHGRVSWLPMREHEHKNELDAMSALVNLGAYDSLEELCEEVLATTTLEVQAGKANIDLLLAPFWGRCYAMWLAKGAERMDGALQKLLSQGRFAELGCRQGPPKTFDQVFERKRKYRDYCMAHFVASGTIPGLANSTKKAPKQAKIGESMVDISSISLPRRRGKVQKTHSNSLSAWKVNKHHIMEAGGVLDLLRFAITCKDPEAVKEVYDWLMLLDLEVDGIEVVLVRNDFHDRKDTQNFKDLQLYAVFQDPATQSRLFVEIRLILRRSLGLKRHKIFLAKEDSQHYSAKGKALFQGCRPFQAAGSPEFATEAEDSSGLGIGHQASLTGLSRTSIAPYDEIIGGDASPMEFGKTPSLSKIGMWRNNKDLKVVNDKGKQKTSFDRIRRFAVGTNSRKYTDGLIIWRWSTPKELREASSRPIEPLPVVQYLEGPEDAAGFTDIRTWVELDGHGALVKLQGEAAKLTRTLEPKDKYHGDRLAKALGIDNVNDKAWIRLVSELEQGVARLYKTEEGKGLVIKVMDYVVVRISNSDHTEEILFRETRPRTLPAGQRSAREPLEKAAARAVHDIVPLFLQNCLEYQPFHPSHGLWTFPEVLRSDSPRRRQASTPDPALRTNSAQSGTSDASAPIFDVKDIITYKRYFTVLAKVKGTPFNLLRAGIGL